MLVSALSAAFSLQPHDISSGAVGGASLSDWNSVIGRFSCEEQMFSVRGVCDGGNIQTRPRDCHERQAAAVRVFEPGGETQAAVSRQRLIWHQRAEQVSSAHILHLFISEVDLHGCPIMETLTDFMIHE